VVVAVALAAAACSGPGGNGASDGAGASSPGTGTVAPAPVGTPVSVAASDLVSHVPGQVDPPLQGVARIGDDRTLSGTGTGAIDVSHYDLALDLTGAGGSLRGVATIDANAVTAIGPTSSTRTVDLDLAGETVDGVTIGDQTARSHLEGTVLHIVPPTAIAAGAPFRIAVRYHGTPRARPTSALPGISIGWEHGSGGSVVLAEPDGAPTWFPDNDHPLDKATFAISVTVPKPLAGVASGRLDHVDDQGDDRDFHWVVDEPMAPYLATVVTGHLHDVTGPTRDGVTFTSWLPDAGPGSFEDPDLVSGSDAVSLLAAKLGPFPFATYGGVVFGDSVLDGQDDASRRFFSQAALEAQGRSLFGADAVSPSTVVHEAAHQWIGDSVSLTDWSKDIWWVEGFAHFAELAFGDGDGDGGSGTGDATVGTTPGSTPGTTPGSTPGPDPSDFAAAYRRCQGRAMAAGDIPAAQLFSDRSYVCGSLVFYALYRTVGALTFWHIMQMFTRRYRYANASTDDLVAVAGEGSGRDLTSFFRDWLSGDLPPLP
jgi:aminopeptidase N